MTRSVIVLELNEVPWKIVDGFTAAQPTSALARLTATSQCYTSIAADRGHLSPWTTWPTLHRGVNDQQHLIASFGQDRRDADARFPPIWRLLHDAGVSVGIFGTLHSYPVPPDIGDYSFYLPDAFATEPTAHPTELETFQRFNLRMSRESARNVDMGVPISDALGVLRRSVALGIRPQTYAAVVAQLVAERKHRWKTNRRRTLQSVLLADVFMHQLKRRSPEFSSFFTNHVASAMHRYWAAAYPEDYPELHLGEEWLTTYRGEIGWAMAHTDTMVNRLMRFVDAHPHYVLVVASSMGQFATHAQPLETQVFVTDLRAFMTLTGLPGDHGWAIRPAMLPQCNVTVERDFVATFESGLERLRVGGAPVPYKRADHGFYSMDFGQNNLHDQPGAVTIDGREVDMRTAGLEAVEIEDRSDTTAYHVPEGILMIYDPTRFVTAGDGRPEVSVLRIAPALLENYGVPRPDYMEPGHDLAEMMTG
ncbi:MAG: hypothetical protein ACRDO2_14055 [Nocardioidaceae bacterium]